MIKLFWEIVVSGFELAMLAAVAAIPVALIALLVDWLAGKRITARFRCWLWVIVALRLIMPFAPANAVSAQNVWTFLNRTPAGQATIELVSAEAAPAPLGEWWNRPLGLVEIKPAPVIKAQVDWAEVVATALIAVWLIGAVWILLRAINATLYFRRKLQSLAEINDPGVIAAIRIACRELGVRAPVIKRVPGIASPAVYGLGRPILCLPAGETFTDMQLRMIALHEAMHIRRRDIWLGWLLTIVRAVHWCNPIAWFTLRRIERHREQACDDAVRQHIPNGERRTYVDLLMRFATGAPSTLNPGLLGLWFASPAQRLASRIVAFTADDRVCQMPRLLSAAVIMVTAFLGLTDAVGGRSASPVGEGSAASGSKMASRFYVGHQDTFEESPEANPIEEKTYDLTAALENADTIPRGADRREWLLRYAKARSNLAAPRTQVRGDTTNQVTITMPRDRHEFFAQVLEEVERLGHTYQVSVETRVFAAESIEQVTGIDWREAVQFTSPPVSHTKWTEDRTFNGEPIARVETVSYEFAPFAVFNLNSDDMQKVDAFLKDRPQSAKSLAPTITLFSGNTGTICVQSQRPFATSVDYVRGELATAAQPNVVVINEGARIDFSPVAHDDDHLDLYCRLTLSSIDRVREVKLPGQEVTIQVPKVTQQKVLTARRMKRGDSLLIASLGERTMYYVVTPRWFADPMD